jgi:glycerol-3-phosphate acyltransferase PlsY
MFEIAGLFALSYIAGSIPFGLIFSSLFSQIDIRGVGSGNIGTANVIRNAGLSAGILTFICDVLKGFIPTLFALKFYDTRIAAIAGLLSVIGHIFSVFLKFRGGKGVATAFGVMLALNLLPALLAFGVFIVVMVIFRISSLSSLSATISILVINLIFRADINIILLNIILCVLIFFKHRENIIRLLRREEPKMWGDEERI